MQIFWRLPRTRFCLKTKMFLLLWLWRQRESLSCLPNSWLSLSEFLWVAALGAGAGHVDWGQEESPQSDLGKRLSVELLFVLPRATVCRSCLGGGRCWVAVLCHQDLSQAATRAIWVMCQRDLSWSQDLAGRRRGRSASSEPRPVCLAGQRLCRLRTLRFFLQTPKQEAEEKPA